jgi:hypothetical protein
MSNIFIRDIVGSNDFAVPTNDTELATATTELDAIVSGVSNLSYDVLIAWVETKDGGSAPRSLNASVQTFEYSGEECPDSTEVQTMTTAIKAALEADVDITSIGEQQVSLFQVSQVQPWLRDSGGFVHTRVATDDIYVGGATPNAVLFDDGDAVFGGSAMSGTEKLRVVGAGRIEGKLTVTGLIDPTGLKCTEQSADPGATGAGEGTFWVKDDSPSTPYFTDDTGADHNLLAGGGSSPWSETAGVLYPTTFGTDDVVVGANAMVGAERFRVAGDARVDSGTLGVRVAPSAIASVYAQDDLSTTATTRAFWATQASVVTGTKAAWEGLLVQCGHTGTGTITDAWGVEVGFTAGSKGTYTRAYGLQTGANLADVDDNIGTYRGIYCGPMSGSGDITNSYGVDIADQGLSSTVAIGVYIRDQTATTAYGVFQSGADDLNIFSGFMELGQDLLLNEHSDHQSTPAAGKGIVWLKDDAPNTLWFTDDAGTDFQIGGAGGGNVWNYSAGVISPANNSDDDTVVVGTTTMSGSGEMVRAYRSLHGIPRQGHQYNGVLQSVHRFSGRRADGRVPRCDRLRLRVLRHGRNRPVRDDGLLPGRRERGQRVPWVLWLRWRCERLDGRPCTHQVVGHLERLHERPGLPERQQHHLEPRSRLDGLRRLHRAAVRGYGTLHPGRLVLQGHVPRIECGGHDPQRLRPLHRGPAGGRGLHLHESSVRHLPGRLGRGELPERQHGRRHSADGRAQAACLGRRLYGWRPGWSWNSPRCVDQAEGQRRCLDHGRSDCRRPGGHRR